MPCWRITHECNSGFTDFGSVARRVGGAGGSPLFGMAEDSGDFYILADGGRFSTTRCESADGTAPLVLHTGGWAAPYGITLVVDMLAAVLLLLSAVLAATVAVYACGDLDDDRFRFGFVPLTLIMMMGVNGAFVAGDVFNSTFGLRSC